LAWDAPAPFAEGSLGEALLAPTEIYVRPALAAVRAGGVHGLAHITGGGLTENIPRLLPSGLRAEIDLAAWSLPPVFQWLVQAAGLAEAETLKTFNCGMGLVLAVAPDRAEALAGVLAAEGYPATPIGRIGPGEGIAFHGNLT
ncbi:MAG: AIR synthase-related protein, partial [Pseudomonadota bacterium]